MDGPEDGREAKTARTDTAAAVRLAGKHGEIHPDDAVAFIYPDLDAFSERAA